MLAARFADGSLLLAIVALIALEAAALVWLWYRRGTGLAPREYLGNLVSGGLLMMAVRAAASCSRVSATTTSFSVTRARSLAANTATQPRRTPGMRPTASSSS